MLLTEEVMDKKSQFIKEYEELCRKYELWILWQNCGENVLCELNKFWESSFVSELKNLEKSDD